jgi:tetratricopeptide (TPR) repeat protein
MHDVFVSYRHSDADQVRLLVAALEARGLRVWFDESSIDDFGSISKAASEGLAEAKALVVYYSGRYPLSVPCQWELTEGFLAAMRLGDPRERVLVVNPEVGPAHIEPVELRDALYGALTPPHLPELDKVADRIATHVAGISGVLGRGIPSVRWLPSQPPRSTRFAGRFTQMWRIHSGLHSNEHPMTHGAAGPGVLQVRGLGGVGKSLLAREYALRFSAGYPGGIFWLYAHGDVTSSSSPTERDALRVSQIRSFMPSVLGDTPGRGFDSLSPEETEAVFKNAIAKSSEPCLWVVDDLPDGLASEEVYRWVGPETASTLFTTRSTEYSGLIPDVPLGVLEPDEALRVLTSHRTPSTDDELEAARRVVEELGGHALAIDVAGATLRFQSFGDLLANLEDSTHDELELAAALREELPTGRERSISRTLSRSLDRLGETGQDLLRIAGMLARDPIPMSLFTATFRETFGSTETEARISTMRALDEVLSLSLIDASDESSWKIHPLVARTVVLKDTEHQRRAALRSGVVSALGVFLQDLSDPLSRKMVAHARRITQEPADLAEARLAGSVGAYDFEVGDYESAKETFTVQVTALKRIAGPGDSLTIAAGTRLGETLKENYDLAESRSVLEEMVTAARRSLGETDVLTPVAIGELCSTLYLLSQTDQAISLGEESLRLGSEVFGPDDPRTLKISRYLARALEASGDLRGSRERIEQTIEAYRRVCGPQHPDTLQAMAIVGKILYESGELQDAAEVTADVLSAMRTVHGDRHPATLLAMNNLAYTLWQKGDLKEARSLAEEALQGEREVVGPKNMDTIAAMDTLACILRDLGDLQGARVLGEQAVPLAIEGLGPGHVETIAEMTNLSDTLRALGEYEEARGVGQDALNNCAELGARHPVTLTTKTSLALTLHACGDLPAALQLAKESLAAHREAFGPEHPQTLRVTQTLADILSRSEGPSG